MSNSHSSLSSNIRAIIEDHAWLHDDEVNQEKIEYIVGIDYGTTFSGFGVYQVPKHENKPLLEPLYIQSYNSWPMQPNEFKSGKFPTVSSYSKKTFAFQDVGWTAVYDYSGECLKFSNIKSLLYSYSASSLSNKTIPKPLDLVHILADFFSCLFSYIKRISPKIHVDNTMWCFTIPVQWENESKLVFSQAATLAGMVSDPCSSYLKLCAEPEAAALTCIQEHKHLMLSGTTLLIMDVGGGKVQFYHCKLGRHGDLEEIEVEPNWMEGTKCLDTLFYDYLRDQLGSKAFEWLFHSYGSAMEATRRDLEVRWQRIKHRFLMASIHFHTSIPLSNALYEIMEDDTKLKLKQKQGTDAQLIMKYEEMQGMWTPWMRDLIQCLYKVLMKKKQVDYFCLIGAVGQYPFFQQCIFQHPSIQAKVNRECLILPDSETVICKGAIRYVLTKSLFAPRRAKTTLALLVHLNSTQKHLQQQQQQQSQPQESQEPHHAKKSKNYFMKKKQRLSLTSSSMFLNLNHQTFYILLRQGEWIHTPIVHSQLSFLHSSATGMIKLYEIRESCTPFTMQCLGQLAMYEPIIEMDSAKLKKKKRTVTLLLHVRDMELKCRVINEKNGREWQATFAYDATHTRIIDPFNTT